jgi:hypothetical protein
MGMLRGGQPDLHSAIPDLHRLSGSSGYRVITLV